MKLRNCLFIVSICLLAGCSKNGDGREEELLRAKLDSANVSYQVAQDSLIERIQELQSQVERLESENRILIDSINDFTAPVNGKSYPKVTRVPTGDPITLPPQKKDK